MIRRGKELLLDENNLKKSFKIVEDILSFKKRLEDLITKMF